MNNIDFRTYLHELFGISPLKITKISQGHNATLLNVALEKNRVIVAKIYTDACYTSHVNSEVYSLEKLRKVSARANGPYIPEVFQSTSCGFLMESLTQKNQVKPNEYFKAGEQVANLHSIKMDHFGFEIDNFLGPTSQINSLSDNWIEFFFEYRLMHQCNLLKKEEVVHEVKALKPIIFNILAQKKSYPSLLHGDLWNGNILFDQERGAVLIDPACYFGDAEADMAMTHLFGGFLPEFYKGYETVIPSEKNNKQRLPIYKLYHLLNHINIYGDSYVAETLNCIKEIKAYG